MRLTSVLRSNMKWEHVGVGRILRKLDKGKLRLPHFVIQSQTLLECEESRGVIPRGHLRLDHGLYISVFEYQALALLCVSKHNIHHCPAQIISANYLVRKQQSKHGIERAYQPVTEIRFLSRLHRVDVGGPEKINARETGCE